MPNITYLKGDATRPQGTGNKILCHVCNDAGHWKKGFVVAVSKRWKEPEKEFRRWARERDTNDFALGAVQFVQVEPDLCVANVLAQRGTRARKDGPLIRYEALREGLRKVRAKALELSATVHMPRIGCGLAGGKWSEIEPMIESILCTAGVRVFVYDFE